MVDKSNDMKFLKENWMLILALLIGNAVLATAIRMLVLKWLGH